MTKPAILALEDGTVFKGVSIGSDGESVGEVVFNTSMTGYQEILTDPSYARQMVTLTYPHIGNTGVNSEDVESDQIWASGLIIRDLPLFASNWRKEKNLDQYLREAGVIGIAGIDTRKLTQILREKGAQGGCMMAGEELSEEKALDMARNFEGLKGMDLVRVVTHQSVRDWQETSWAIGEGYGRQKESTYHVVAYDFGVKNNILRMLADKGCKLTVVPATTPAKEVLSLSPDGIFLSNGPGDPEPCDYAIKAIKKILKHKIPLFGICLGHQLLALASGAKTVKMKFGHHGANHPVQNLSDGTVVITSQNHGFAVDATTLPENLQITHRSLFDGSLQGIRRTDTPAFGFQGHPEASPGPHDVAHLFDHFIDMMKQAKY